MMSLLDIVEGLLLLRVVTIIIVGVVLLVVSDSQSQSQSSSTSTFVTTIRWLLEWSNIIGWILLSSVCIYRLIVIKSFNNNNRWCWVDYTRDDDENRSGGFSVSHLRSILNAIRDNIFSTFYYQNTASERSDYERTERSQEPTSFLSHYSTMSQIYPAFGSDKKRYDEDNLSKATKFQHVFYGDTLSKSQVDSSSSTIELSTFTSGTPPASRRGLLPPQKMSLDRGEDTLNTNNPNEGSYYNETTSSTLQNRKDL